MSETWTVLATGSRYFSSPHVIRAEFMLIAAEHPGREIVLAHGMCDPRGHTRILIPWRTAGGFAREAKLSLLGADWLCDAIASELGWQVKRYPADWAAPCRTECRPGHRRWGVRDSYCPAAGMYRNGDMVKAGADECAPFPEPGEANTGTEGCVSMARRANIPLRRITS